MNLSDAASDPIGTIYTLLSSPSGSITGPFLTANIPSNFSNLSYTANSVTVEKTSLISLPVIWRSFTVQADHHETILRWSTAQESNTAYFVVEHSTDGLQFAGIATITAKGNSSTPTDYIYTHTAPDLNSRNCYRIRQVDLDGQATYSIIRVITFKQDKAKPVQVTPNPVCTIMQVTVFVPDVRITMHDLHGKLLRSWQLAPGIHPLNIQDLPAGTYQLTVYEKQQQSDSWRIIKL
jgi:hypothetical protein